MKYKYIIPTLYIFSTLSLYAEEKELGSILKEAGQKKTLVKSEPIQKKKIKKQSRFVFKDDYNVNVIGSKEKSAAKNKSQSYEYDNKSRFKFKFNDGSEQSNIVGGYGSGTSMSGGSIGGGSGRRGGGGRR
jgi:hypothetical protein